MEVLIIATNRNHYPTPVLPYGACIVAEAAAREGHRVSFLDLMFRPDPVKAVETALSHGSPDVVGLSVRNLDNNDMQAPVAFVNELTDIIQAIGRKSSAPVVLGGPALGVMPEQLLRCTRASYAVLGDGEAAFPALLRALENRGRIEETPRLAWLENGCYRLGSQALCQLRPEAAAPAFEQWLDLQAYRSANAAIPVQSKRGCPFSCIYCTYGMSEGKEYRLIPPPEAAHAVNSLAARGYRDLEFVDNVFNSPYSHAMSVCEHLARAGSKARLITMEMNPAFVDGALLKAMEAAGFVGVGLTAESAADPVLAGLEKGYARAEVEHAAAAVRRSNLPCFWLFLLGGPGENEQTVTETLNFARRVLRKGDAAFVTMGIRIYPGTKLERIARQQGVLSRTPQEMLQPVFYFSPELSLSWTREQVQRAAADNLNLLYMPSLSHPWLPAINRLFHRLPLRPPLWRYTWAIRKVVRALGRDI